MMVNRSLGLLALLMLLGGVALADEFSLVAEGPLAGATGKSDWLAQENSDKNYTENWMTMVRSDAGHVLYINFLRTNIGVFKGSSGVSVSLTEPGGQARHLAFEHSADEFAFDKELNAVRIGVNSLRLDGSRILMVVKEGDFELDLELKLWTKGVKFHGGKGIWGTKKKWMQVFVHAPRATVTGTMTLDGKKVDLKGDGYVDHLRQNILGHEYASRWFVNRLFHKDWTLILISFRTPEKHGGQFVHRLLLTDREKVLLHTNEVTLTVGDKAKDPKGHNYHKSYEFSSAEGALTVTATATGDRLHDRDAMTERMNAAQAGVVKMVAGKPITYRMEGRTKATITLPDKSPVTIEGASWMESVVLKDE